MSFGEKILPYREAILKDLAELVNIPSVRDEAKDGMPFGEACAKALQTALDQAARMGLTVKNLENYAGHAEYGQGEEYAAVLAHVDVVPAGEGWSKDPYTMVTENGLCYGRGTADDKGAAIVALYALKILMDEKVPAKRRLRVILGAGEETGSEDMAYYFSKEPLPSMGFTPDADYGICNREKGLLRMHLASPVSPECRIRSFSAGTVCNAVPGKAEAEIRCTCQQTEMLRQEAENLPGEMSVIPTEEGCRILAQGRSCHAMQPQEGLNAASCLITLLGKVFTEEEIGSLLTFAKSCIGMEYSGNALGVACEDLESGPLTLNLGLVNQENESGSLDLDIRYPVTKDGNFVAESITEKAQSYGLTASVEALTPPLFLPENQPLIRLLKTAYKNVTGEDAVLYATGGGTYARSLQSKGVAFGPIFADEGDRRLHNTDENIDIERFMLHAQICLEAMYQMLTAD